MALDTIVCPSFSKLCTRCSRYFPAEMTVCGSCKCMLVSHTWDSGTDDLDSWLARSRFFGSKHCLRCNKHFRQLPGAICPDDGGILEKCLMKETDGPILAKKYQLKSFIGTGKLSRAYRATEVDIEAPRVVKFLRTELAEDEKTVTRYVQLSKGAISLQHPNIVRTFASGVTTTGAAFVVTQYIPGKSLKDEVATAGPLEELAAVNLFIELARGLQYAHAKSAVHSNLTTSNIFITPKVARLFPTIIDFGLAERLFRTVDWSDSDEMTHTNNVYGDPRGIAPEFCGGQKPTMLSDIYQMGCCLYEALNGRPPFQRDQALATIMAHSKEQPDAFNENVSETLKTITLECLKKNPDERFQSATEFRFVLEECRRQLSSTHTAAAPPTPGPEEN